MNERFVCVHGHFYQPPRENPWLEEVERQESASPYHDWNERVCREAYAPNAFSRILDERGRIVRVMNNYRWMSFDFGPTLLSWMERSAPETYAAVLEADRASAEHFSGHGSAMAQAYNHMILPLASTRDKRTQILWGIQDFRQRFGREPEGMWLPETAVDLESLDLMAAAGIRFTVLAPRQAKAVRRDGDEDWTDVGGERVDPGRAYRVGLPSGRSMAVFFYQGDLSRAVAFENLLVDGGNLARRLLEAGGDGRGPGSLTHVATDGETYGHHHRHGEMALSYALRLIQGAPGVRITNYGEYLELHPPEWEARIVEDSSWSCVHGVERWRSDCGCSTGGQTEWRQAWRRPLREALDWLRDELVPRYEKAAADLLDDPWGARDRYIEVVLDRSEQNVARFLEREAGRPLEGDERTRALKLLELQRQAMLMFTSCGWFFDDLARIETLQVLRYAARALHLNEVLFEDGLDGDFRALLARARSNVPALGAGDQLYRTRVAPSRVSLGKVAAHFAVSSLFENGPPDGRDLRRVYCYEVEVDEERRMSSGGVRMALGRVAITSTITRTRGRFSFAVLHLGDHNLVGGVRPFEGDDAYVALARELEEIFQDGRSLELIRVLDREFRASTYSLHSLFQDEQERVVQRILESSLADAERVLGTLFESRLPLMRFLAGLQIPQPAPFRAAGEFILNTRLEKALAAPEPELERAEELIYEAQRAGLRLDRETLGFAAAGAMERLLSHLEREPEADGTLQHALRLAELIRGLPFPTDLWDAQNSYFRILDGVAARRREAVRADDPRGMGWIHAFLELGDELGIAPWLDEDEAAVDEDEAAVDEAETPADQAETPADQAEAPADQAGSGR